MAIRKLVKPVKYYSGFEYCEKGCDCEVCKVLRYAKKEDAKLTEIIDASKRCREIVKNQNRKRESK